MTELSVFECPLGQVCCRVSPRGSVTVDAHSPAELALAAITGARCTCDDMRMRLVEGERLRRSTQLYRREPVNSFPFAQWAELKRQDRRVKALKELPRASMPALVRYLVPRSKSRYWARSVRKLGMVHLFGRQKLGEGVAYCESLGFSHGRFARAILVACNDDGQLVARLKFVEKGINEEAWREFKPGLVDAVKARMLLPTKLDCKEFVEEEKQNPTRIVW